MSEALKRMVTRRTLGWAGIVVGGLVILALSAGLMSLGGQIEDLRGQIEDLRSVQIYAEGSRLAEQLTIEAGMTVAEVGAGRGELTIAIAERLGVTGRMLSTELDPDYLDTIREAAAVAGLENVTVVEAGVQETNLPPGCCHAVFMREVYHHLTHPEPMNKSLFEAIRPGGLLAVIDFDSRGVALPPVPGVPENRGGHGVPRNIVIEEVTEAGFELIRTIEQWSRRSYLVLFRRR